MDIEWGMKPVRDSASSDETIVKVQSQKNLLSINGTVDQTWSQMYCLHSILKQIEFIPTKIYKSINSEFSFNLPVNEKWKYHLTDGA